MPILLILHVVILMRNLAFSHSEEETSTLASYLTLKFQTARLMDVTRILAEALHVNAAALDVKDRVTVCPGLFLRVLDECLYAVLRRYG